MALQKVIDKTLCHGNKMGFNDVMMLLLLKVTSHVPRTHIKRFIIAHAPQRSECGLSSITSCNVSMFLKYFEHKSRTCFEAYAVVL